MIQIQNPVQMVGFVFHRLRQHTLRFQPLRLALQILVAHPYPLGAAHHPPVAGQAQAPLFHFPQPFPPDDFRVHQRHCLVPLLQLDDHHPLQHAHLVGGQPHAAVRRHRLLQIRRQPRQPRVKPRHLARPPPQDRVGKHPHFQHGHNTIRPPAPGNLRRHQNRQCVKRYDYMPPPFRL